jgi:hypothetical protein
LQSSHIVFDPPTFMIKPDRARPGNGKGRGLTVLVTAGLLAVTRIRVAACCRILTCWNLTAFS